MVGFFAWLLVLTAIILIVAHGIFWKAALIGCALFAAFVIIGSVLTLFD